MADATAITGIIVSGVVGPSLAAWWARGLARSQDRRNRESDDLKELRVLLDEALGHFDALIRHYDEFSSAWDARELQPSAETAAAMEAAYAALARDGMVLLEMHGRFDARLGPDHPLSKGFAKLQDDAWTLTTTPGGVASTFDAFTKEDRERVRELGKAELAAFVAQRRDWVIESLPLAGLRLPGPEPHRRVTTPSVAKTGPAG